MKNPIKSTEITLKVVIAFLGHKNLEWANCVKVMTDIHFLKHIKEYKKDEISAKIIERVRPFVTNE